MTTNDDFFADMRAMLGKLTPDAEGNVNLDDLPDGELAAFVEKHRPEGEIDAPPQVMLTLAMLGMQGKAKRRRKPKKTIACWDCEGGVAAYRYPANRGVLSGLPLCETCAAYVKDIEPL